MEIFSVLPSILSDDNPDADTVVVAIEVPVASVKNILGTYKFVVITTFVAFIVMV